jgi:hypothetical protein
MRLYLFGVLPFSFRCMGGSAPTPAAPPPPPQLAKIPSAASVRSNTSLANVGQGGSAPTTTLLSGGQGDPTAPDVRKKTLLGA